MESFGLATAEALGRGLPVAGFADCPRNKSTGSYGEKWRFGQWNRPGGILSRGIACLVIKSSDILPGACARLLGTSYRENNFCVGSCFGHQEKVPNGSGGLYEMRQNTIDARRRKPARIHCSVYTTQTSAAGRTGNTWRGSICTMENANDMVKNTSHRTPVTAKPSLVGSPARHLRRMIIGIPKTKSNKAIADMVVEIASRSI